MSKTDMIFFYDQFMWNERFIEEILADKTAQSQVVKEQGGLDVE